MKIGITYDTAEMYFQDADNHLHFDFAESLSINKIKRELRNLGCTVELIGNKDDLLNLIKQGNMDFDLIYNTVEGLNSRNREALVPAILEACNINYMGTDSFGLSMTLDKALMKCLAERAGILTPKYCLFRGRQLDEEPVHQMRNMKYPVIIKPNFEGNSSGISIGKDFESALNTVRKLLSQYQTSILCEEFISGQEITVPVIGNDLNHALWGVTTVDIQTTGSFWLDVNTKVYGNYKNVILNLSDSLKAEYFSIIQRLYTIIGCRDFARFDFRMTDDNKIYFIEANPLPAIFIGGSFDVVGRSVGYNYRQTLQLMVNTAADRLSIPKI